MRPCHPPWTTIYRDLEPPDLKPMLDAAGVDRVVVVQAAETLAEALFIIGLSRKFPWIAGIVAWLDPASPACEEETAALGWNPIVKGVRPVRNDNATIAWMLDPGLERGGTPCGLTACRWTFLFRTGAKYRS